MDTLAGQQQLLALVLLQAFTRHFEGDSRPLMKFLQHLA